MSNRDLCFLTLAEQSRLVRRGEVSPMELVAAALHQIHAVDGLVNAYITVLADEAQAAARNAEQKIARGGYAGPLHGIPIALKDLFYTKGVRTTGGSRVLKDFVPAEDATVVARLRAAGAVILGKTNMSEFAVGGTGTNPHYGSPRNPWDLERISGGSSSGSAVAVACGMAAAALGSDTGGSVRIPAALCGVTGLKPTYGRVSLHGVIPCAPSLDHVGPLVRTAEDAAIVLAAIAGWDERDPTTSRERVPDYLAEMGQGLQGLKIAVLREYIDAGIQQGVRAAFEESVQVLRDLGSHVDEVTIPFSGDALAAPTAIFLTELAAYHEPYLRTRGEEYGPEVRERVELGRRVPPEDYQRALRVRALVAEQLRAVFQRFDAIICPTEPATAPRFGEDHLVFDGVPEPIGTAVVRLTRMFNLTGLPAVTVPCGFDSLGLPTGLQIVAAPFAEGTALGIANAYQQVTTWHRQVPRTALLAGQ
ncbi:MAG: amidase [Chloroflexota bacterium]